jgi:general nucleoside transport system ATP-binding protein
MVKAFSMDVQVVGGIPAPLLSLRRISKRFGRVQANQDVSIDVYPGSILGLLGENGAGKSTLMSILDGVLQADSGAIWWQGKPVRIRDPHEAAGLGIGMVHQHFSLIPELTVAENIILGQKTSRQVFLNMGTAYSRIRALSQQYGLEVNPDARVWELSLGVRQRVEILKVLYRGSRLLVLDEPTAVLTPQETDQLLQLLMKMADEGVTIIFVSHKFREVRAICRRVVVMRAGRVVGDLDLAAITDRELARLMIGEEVSTASAREAPSVPAETGLLHVQSLAAHNELGLTAFTEVNFDVHKGEIAGIAGIAGNGQAELVECLAGLRPVIQGRIFLEGEEITHFSSRQRRAKGLAHIPEDRRGVGCVLDFSLEDNLILGEHYRFPVARNGVLNLSAIHSIAAQRLKAYNVKAAQSTIAASTLSGGNLQKLVLARELSSSPRMILAIEPTRGLDIAAVEFTYQQLLDLQAETKGILLVSSDLDEVLRLSDRIFVMYRGQLIGPLPAGTTRKEVGYTMLTGERLETKGGG